MQTSRQGNGSEGVQTSRHGNGSGGAQTSRIGGARRGEGRCAGRRRCCSPPLPQADDRILLLRGALLLYSIVEALAVVLCRGHSQRKLTTLSIIILLIGDQVCKLLEFLSCSTINSTIRLQFNWSRLWSNPTYGNVSLMHVIKRKQSGSSTWNHWLNVGT